MPTVANQTRSNNRRTSNKPAGAPMPVESNLAFLASFAEAIGQEYGVGTPKYKLERVFGSVSVINNADNAFDDFFTMRDTLKLGQAAVAVSEWDGREAFSLGIKTSERGCVYAGLMHGKDGVPTVEPQLTLIEVTAIEDIAIDDVVVVAKGTKLYKAVSADYLAKLQK